MKSFLLGFTLLLALPVWAQNKITMRVVDPHNAPIAGASVYVRLLADPERSIPLQVTGMDGKASFDIPNGADGKMAIGNFCVVASGFGFTNWAINNESLDVHMVPGVTARGKVVDEAGKPIAGALVRVRYALTTVPPFLPISLFSERNTGAYTVTSDVEGKFSIADLPAKMEAKCTVSHPDYALQTTITLSPGKDTTITLAPGGALKGQVLDLNGRPMTSAKVEINPVKRGADGNSSTTDPNGSYTVNSLATGLYDVKVSVESATKNPEFVFPRLSNIRVEAGQTLDLPAISAIKGFLIQGIVCDAATRKPVANAHVTAQEGRSNYVNADTDATGHFRLRVTEGTYKVSLSSPPEGYLQSPQKISITVGETLQEPITFNLQKAKVLRGTMVDEAGKLIRGKVKADYFNSIQADAQGKWQYQFRDENPLPLVGGDVEDGYYEIVSTFTLKPTMTGPVTIVLRKKPWQVLPGRALTSDGKPLEGVQIDGNFSIPKGESNGLDTSERRAVTNANGDFVLSQVRDGIRTNSNYFEVTAKKEGFAFLKGGQLSKNGPVWQISDFIFTALNLKTEGTTEPGAQVTAGGVETIADERGSFTLEGLPATERTVWAFKGRSFGGGESDNGKVPNIALHPQEVQPRDPALARQIWKDVLDESQRQGKPYGRTAWLERHLSEVPPDFQTQLAKALDDGAVADVIRRFSGKVEVPVIEPALARIKDEEWRELTALQAAQESGDRKFAERVLQAFTIVLKTPETDQWIRECSLYYTAPLTAHTQGEEAGLSALDRALAFTLKNHPENSVSKQGIEVITGRNDMLVRQTETVANGGLVMVRRLMENIEPETGDEAAVLMSAIPVLARRDGVQSVLPLLDELEKMPEPVLKPGRMQRVSQSPEWAFGVVAVKVLPLLGKESPAQALQLAMRVKSGAYQSGFRAKALAIAARFQTPEEAAKLWRQAVAEASATTAPRYAAQAFEFDPKLGFELFQIARQKVKDEDKDRFAPHPHWANFSFYFARANAAEARFIIEREWATARMKKEENQDPVALALAMSAIDGQRAWQMAREIPADNFSSSQSARRQIGIYLSASEETRRDFPFDRERDWEEWEALED